MKPKNTYWRKTFLCLSACAALSGALVQTTAPVFAQATPAPAAQTIAQQLQAVTSGTLSVTQMATNLSTSQFNVAGLTTGDYQGVITNLLGNTGANANAAVGILGALSSGNLDMSLATNLSQITGIGNISNIAGLNTVMQSISPALSAITNVQQQLNAISTVLSTSLSPAGIAALAGNPALQASLAGNLLSQFPQLSQLGNAVQLAGALGQFAQQLETLGPAGVIQGLITGLLGGSSSLTTMLAALTTGGMSGPTTSLSTYTPTLRCCAQVASNVPRHYFNVRTHVNNEFIQHRTWFVGNFWLENILPALMLMAEQLTATGVLQVEMFGTLLDAKHQLETQRLFQELTARAHKDYQPSEGMCQIGTATKSLAASERLSNLAQASLTQRLIQRQTLSGANLTVEGNDSDFRSRRDKFIATYCSPHDNANNLETLCPSVPTSPRQNIDIDYTRNVESRLTLDVNFTGNNATPTADEEDIFALSSNLFAHNIVPRISPTNLGDGQGRIRQGNVEKLMNLRAVIAKRSVAQNSFAAITAQRASGDTGSAPYTKRLINELGITSAAEIDSYLGQNPSYFAQMEVLTKKIYQNPTFYTELYDKPANVERKGAALQAIGLMQDRDLYNSLIRSEAVLSVLLETMLEKEQEKVVNAARKAGVLSE